MKKKILRNLGAGASNKAVALGFVALVSAGGAFAGYSNYMASSSNGIAAVAAEEDPITEADKKAQEKAGEAITGVRTDWEGVQKNINSLYFDNKEAGAKSVYETFGQILDVYSKKIDEAKAKFDETPLNEFAESAAGIIAMLPDANDIKALESKAAVAKNVFAGMKFESFAKEIETAKGYVDKNQKLTTWAPDTATVGGELKAGQLQNVVETYRQELIAAYVKGLGTVDASVQSAVQANADAVGFCTYTKAVTDKNGKVTTPEKWTFSDATTLLGKFKQRFDDEEAALIKTNKLDSCFKKIDADVALMTDTWKADKDYAPSKETLDAAKKNLVEVEEDINDKEKGIETYTSKASEWNTNITSIESDWKTAWTAINGIVETSLNKDIEKVQKSLNDCNYEISAKYQNEPAVQKEYKDKFAAIQKEIDAISKEVKDSKTATSLVGKNKEISKKIEDVAAKIKDLYDEAGLAQSKAIQEANDKTWKAFGVDIEKLNKEYLDHINRMGEYEKIAELAKKEEVKAEIVSTRNELFPYRGTIDKFLADNEKLYNEAGSKTYYTYNEKEVSNISEGMEALRNKACTAINGVAYEMMFTNAQTTYDKKGEFNVRIFAINDAKAAYPAENYKWVNDSIVSLYNRYFEVKENDKKETAFELLDKYNKKEVVADHMAELTDSLTQLDGYLKLLVAEGTAQKNVLEGIVKGDEVTALGFNQLTDYWTKAWGNKDANSEAALQATYNKITALQADFKKKSGKGEVAANEEDFFTRINELYNEVYKYADAEGYKNNQDAYADLNTKFDEITKAIADTRKAIEGYEKSVQDEFMPKTDGVESSLEALKGEVEELLANRVLADNNVEVAGKADALKAEIEKIAEDAAAAQKAATVVEGDVNGDNIVDAKDLGVVLGCFSGAITDEAQRAKADFNGDGKVTALDVRFIKNKMAEQ